MTSREESWPDPYEPGITWALNEFHPDYDSWIIIEGDPETVSLAIYLPPGALIPPTREEYLEFERTLQDTQEVARYRSSWAKATYEDLDSEDEDADLPVMVEEMSLAEVVAEVPADFHDRIRQETLAYLRRIRAAGAGGPNLDHKTAYDKFIALYKQMAASCIDAFGLEVSDEIKPMEQLTTEEIKAREKNRPPKMNIDEID